MLLTNVKDEYAIVLDFLPQGKPGERRVESIAQVIGENYYVLLEVGIKDNAKVEIGQRVYIGSGLRDIVRYIKKRIKYDELTNIAKSNLEILLEKNINEKRIVDFFNKAQPISLRLHSLELLPGIGKKTVRIILEERRKKPFESLEELEKRVGLVGSVKKIIIKRIISELKEEDKYRLFVGVSF